MKQAHTYDNEYKPSFFNHLLRTDNDIIIYNSMEGVSSIRKLPLIYEEKAAKYFSASVIPYRSDSILNAFINHHYVIPCKLDEKLYLDNLYVACVNDSVLHLVILPTEQCNFRCKYCYESFKRGKMSDEVIQTIIKYVRVNIRRYIGLQVSWFGGEPSLEIDTICKMSNAFLAICRHAKREYWADITSNGYLIDKCSFEKLYHANIFNYQITIDGIKSTHDSQRILAGGGESYDKIINNLIDIKNNKECRHWKISIRTNFQNRFMM